MLVLKSRIWILSLLVMAVSAASGYGARARDRFLLRDGFFLQRADGEISVVDSNEGGRRYFFEFESDVSDGRARVKAGSSLELLPSSGLEQMITGLGDDLTGAYRLWGHTTRYRGKNYVFAVTFLPLRASHAVVGQSQGSSDREQSKEAVNETGDGGATDRLADDANDTVRIPANVLEKLKGKKVRRTIKLDKPASGDDGEVKKPKKRFKLDSVTVGRVGFISSSEQVWRVGWSTEFVLDSSGRGVEDVRFELLPCEALERAEDRQLYELEGVRLKVAGLVTEFMGKKYLLLQRAVQAYGHGNFDR